MKWSPSLRAKVIFFALASIVLLGICLTLATVVAVQSRKRVIVNRAQKLVEDHARELSERLTELAGKDDLRELEILLREEWFRQVIRSVVRQEDPVLVRLQTEGGPAYLIWRGADGAVEVEVETVEATGEAQARRPIHLAGQPPGDIVVKYAPGVLLSRIQEAGREITVWLASLAGGLTILLVLAFFLLWRIFQRHLERERTHEQLDRMAYVGTLASGLAHEIRNPLNALSLNLDVIGEEMEDPQVDSPERTRNIVGIIKSEIGRLNVTLTNFLQLALPRNEQMRMTDVVALLNETVTLLEPEMRESQVRFRFVGERSCVTQADPSALRQMFWNVLLNAVQALEGRDERRIETHCRVEDGACRIEVRDTGPGIPPDQREEVFAVFHSRRSGGSGIGLAIARQVVDRHGGSIRIDSLDGWGCVVHVSLPLRVGESGATENTNGK